MNSFMTSNKVHPRESLWSNSNQINLKEKKEKTSKQTDELESVTTQHIHKAVQTNSRKWVKTESVDLATAKWTRSQQKSKENVNKEYWIALSFSFRLVKYLMYPSHDGKAYYRKNILWKDTKEINRNIYNYK